MRVFKLKRTRSRVHQTRRYPLYASMAAIAVLAAALTFVSIARQRSQGQLALGQRQLAAQIQSNLNSATLSFDKMSLPGANLTGDVLPAMRLHLFAADELNKVMVETYGLESSMIDEEIYQQIELALTRIERNISEGVSYDSARETLRAYMAQMEVDLNARFAGTELLMTRGSLK